MVEQDLTTEEQIEVQMIEAMLEERELSEIPSFFVY